MHWCHIYKPGSSLAGVKQLILNWYEAWNYGMTYIQGIGCLFGDGRPPGLQITVPCLTKQVWMMTCINTVHHSRRLLYCLQKFWQYFKEFDIFLVLSLSCSSCSSFSFSCCSSIRMHLFLPCPRKCHHIGRTPILQALSGSRWPQLH